MSGDVCPDKCWSAVLCQFWLQCSVPKGMVWRIRQYPDWTNCYQETFNRDRNFLSNELHLYLQDVPLATQGRMQLHHYMTPPHFGREVRQFLNENYEDGMEETHLTQLVTQIEPIRFTPVVLKEVKSSSRWYTRRKPSSVNTDHK